MVQLKGDNRYYGRGATVNRILGGGDVDRLHLQRRRWEENQDDLLTETIGWAPIEPNPDSGYLHLVVRPVSRHDQLFFDLLSGTNSGGIINELIQESQAIEGWNHGSYPGFSTGHSRRTSEGIILYMASRQEREPRGPDEVLDLGVHVAGTMTLFSARIAERGQADGPGQIFYLFEDFVPDLTVRFLSLAAATYHNVGFYGALDLGLALTGIKGTISHWLRQKSRLGYFNDVSFDKEEYRATTRQLVPSLQKSVLPTAERLVRQFLLAATQGRYRPFDEFKQAD